MITCPLCDMALKPIEVHPDGRIITLQKGGRTNLLTLADHLIDSAYHLFEIHLPTGPSYADLTFLPFFRRRLLCPCGLSMPSWKRGVRIRALEAHLLEIGKKRTRDAHLRFHALRKE